MNRNQFQARQGDLFFVPVKPEEVKGRKQKNNVIALGELTGHSHELVEGEVLQDKGTKFLVLSKASKVVHQEHNPVALEKGTYKVTRQREYKPTKLRPVKVID